MELKKTKMRSLLSLLNTPLGYNEAMETADYSKELGKLNRISGQVDGIKDMIVAKRPATDIIIQLKAVRASVKSIETIILEDHLTKHLLTAKDPCELEQRIKETTHLYKKSEF